MASLQVVAGQLRNGLPGAAILLPGLGGLADLGGGGWRYDLRSHQMVRGDEHLQPRRGSRERNVAERHMRQQGGNRVRELCLPHQKRRVASTGESAWFHAHHLHSGSGPRPLHGLGRPDSGHDARHSKRTADRSERQDHASDRIDDGQSCERLRTDSVRPDGHELHRHSVRVSSDVQHFVGADKGAVGGPYIQRRLLE